MLTPIISDSIGTSPFLNGGLFEADYIWQEANITIPENLFRNEEKNKSGDEGTGILDVFTATTLPLKKMNH